LANCRQHKFRSSVRIQVPISEQFLPKVLIANIRGGFIDKADELETMLRNNDVDIACITETWLRETVPTGVLSLPDYVVHRNDRQDG